MKRNKEKFLEMQELNDPHLSYNNITSQLNLNKMKLTKKQRDEFEATLYGAAFMITDTKEFDALPVDAKVRMSYVMAYDFFVKRHNLLVTPSIDKELVSIFKNIEHKLTDYISEIKELTD